jgi:membrane protease YdiL (CAAX protease family)
VDDVDELALSMGFSAGFYEETIVRGVTIPIGMRYLKGKNKILLIAIGTSLIFGLSHLGNVSQGATMSMAIIQTIASGFNGLFFAAVVLRTGSILTSVVMHGFYDWLCFVTDPTLENGIMTNPEITGGLMIQLAIAVALGIAGLYLIRPAVSDKIENIWEKKWTEEMSLPDSNRLSI